MTKTLILGFDTSSAHVAAALFDGHDVIAAAHEEMARGQAERLMPMLQEVLRDAGATMQDLSALGVGVGPGNFTGIRLSVSAARGLSLGLKIPAVGVSLLEAVAFATPGARLACLSGPREQAYVQGFDMRAEIPPRFMKIEDTAPEWGQQGLLCMGSAAQEVSGRIGATVVPAAFAPASAVARIAALRWQDAPPRPAPLYLKPADAAPARDRPPAIVPAVGHDR